MRWFQASLLPALCLGLIAQACPTGYRAADDVHQRDFIKRLFRRVRTGPNGSLEGGGGTAKDLFLIEDGKGSCSGEVGTIDNWLNEARLLHTAVETAYANAERNPPNVIHWLTYFGVQWDFSTMTLIDNPLNKKIWANIGDHIARVTRFLSGLGLENNQKPGENPRLFCSADAFEHQDWGRAVRDENDKDVVLEKDPNTGLPTEYLTLQEAFPPQKSQGGNAFWVDAFNGYDFSFTGSTTMCPTVDAQGRTRYARTARPTNAFPAINHGADFTFGKGNRHILLCPPTFTPVGGHSYPSLTQAVSKDGYPPAGRNTDYAIDKMLTVSATLYHEIYHLTDNDNTKDQAYRFSEIIANAANEDAREGNSHNPETYAFIAMALYLLQNPPQGATRILYTGSFPDLASKWGYDN